MDSLVSPTGLKTNSSSSRSGITTLLLSLLLIVTSLSGCASTPATSTKSAAAYSELGMSYLAQGNNNRAYQAFQHSLRISSNNASALHGIALIEQANGDNARADEYYQRTLRTLSKSNEIPDNGSISMPQVRNNYAALLFEEGNFNQACQQLSEASRDTHYPGRPGILVNLSQCQLKIGNITEAQTALSEAKRIAPDQPLVLLAQAYLDFNRGNLDASRAQLTHYEHLYGQTHDSKMLRTALDRAPETRNQPLNRAQ